MGNILHSVFVEGCIHQCFGRRYQQWKQSIEFDGLDFRRRAASVPPGGAARHNRIAEYIAWALNRSRSPLLLDDALSSTPVEVNSSDFGGVNAVSWISDAAASDASHVMYREMDPYNYASVANSLIPSPTLSSADSGEPTREGSWVAVTRLANSKSHTVQTTTMFKSGLDQGSNQLPSQKTGTTVSHCDEEVDGLELARLVRNLWPNSKSGRRSTGVVALPDVKPNRSSNLAHSLESNAKRPSSAAMRPQDLNIRPTVRQPGQLFRMEDPLQSNLWRSDTESPMELDWDHEPGTVSPQRKKTNPTRPIPAIVSNTNGRNGRRAEEDGFTEVSLFPVRPRRHPRAVVNLPIQLTEVESGMNDGSAKIPVHSKRWSCSDKLLSATSIHRMHPTVPAQTAIPCSNLFTSPTDDETLTGHCPPSDDLFDSGFAGLSQSFADGDSDGCGIGSAGGGRLNDFLWEHEMFEDTRFPSRNHLHH
ncbi:hypothetical protein CRM22_007199 [Opisthorchis felineus]|uniref:Uncharacterized protein n=1 Tax=Opisthorchis felineus TaxID=147828 RepID=A0A4S2LPS6_OPIFE|nr:hypothetical protein CRM22_007199 [Opisthorchis felineus]